MPSKRVLIIGGHGYVGSVVTNHMLQQGHAVTVVDRQSVKENIIVGGGNSKYTHIQCSIGQIHDHDVDIGNDFDVIVYLGGITKPKGAVSVGYAGDAISEFGRLVDGLTNDQCLIYTSSAGVYGNTNGKLAKESDPLPQAINVYDYTKRCMDLVAEMYAGKKKIFGLRLASVCGHSPKFWKSPILNAMICDAINEGQVTVANATKNRGIIGFDDLCRVLNVVIEKGKLEDSGVFNIGSFNATVGELAQMVVDRYHCKLKVNDGADRSPYDFLLDTNKFEQVFDFTFSDNVDSIGLSLEPLWANPKAD